MTDGVPCDLCTMPVQGPTPVTNGAHVFCSPACRTMWIQYRSDVERERRAAILEQFVATLKLHCRVHPR